MRAEVRRRAIANALATAPGLGAFTVAVGQLGLDGAVRLCRTRRPKPELRRAWEELGYRIQQLPYAEEIRLFLIGVEVAHVMEIVRVNHYDPAPLLKKLGHSMADVGRGRKVLQAYGADPSPTRQETGAF